MKVKDLYVREIMALGYLEEAVGLLRAWTQSTWEDFIKNNPSPLLHNTEKWLENIDRVRQEKYDKG